ncbi:MAG: family 10 glycosylhydrolase [Deltaproteobacteria bacterium]|nr:family 10 glycosylhydrolase [Deltaproteobacteria bacterium]
MISRQDQKKPATHAARRIDISHGLLLLLLVLLGCASCTPRTGAAAWVIRHDVDSAEKIDNICAAAKEADLDELLVQVRGRADAFYHSEIAPWPESLAGAPPGFDPLAETLARCAPLPVQAWLNVYYLWGGTTPPRSPAHPGSPQQPWILRDDEGRPLTAYSEFDKKRNWLEGVYADPASPEYRQLFAEVVRELVSHYPVSGIHLDFIRYPGDSFGRGGSLGREFAGETGIDPRLLPDHLTPDLLFAWLHGRQSPADRVLTLAALYWKEMRARQVTELLKEVRGAIKKHGGNDLKLSAAVFPDPGPAYLENGQDWRSWVADEEIDALYPMAYFGNNERVAAQLREVAAGQLSGSPVKIWAGLGAYIKDSRRIGEEAKIAASNGYNGIALFSLGHLLHGAEPLAAYTGVSRGLVSFSSNQLIPL